MSCSEQGTLRSAVLGLVSGDCPEADLSHFVRLTHALSLTALRYHLASDRNSRGLTGLSLNDLAYDAIADLFQRDQTGTYLQLRAYFGGIDVTHSPEQDLLIHLRRLVFSKVQHAVFRFYNEYDPSLGKIIRNIKRTVSILNNFEEIDRFGEVYLQPACCDPLLHLPFIEREPLEQELRGLRTRRENIPDLLSCLSRCLREQEEHARLVPLTTIAIVFRVLLSDTEPAVVGRNSAEQNMLVQDLERVINDACRATRKEHIAKYVEKGKVSDEIFASYFHVIEDNLRMIFLDKDGDHYPFFEQLRKVVPDMTRDEYKRKHKNRLEYLARLVEKRVRQRLMKELV